MQPCPPSLLPPKKRKVAPQNNNGVTPVQSEAKPEPSEGEKATGESESQPSPTADLAKPAAIADSVAVVETSKIRGSAPPRKPRVGEQYQAELPQLLERPQER